MQKLIWVGLGVVVIGLGYVLLADKETPPVVSEVTPQAEPEPIVAPEPQSVEEVVEDAATEAADVPGAEAARIRATASESSARERGKRRISAPRSPLVRHRASSTEETASN